MVDSVAVTVPMFWIVLVTAMLCPCVAVAGGSETAVATRSGDSRTWIPRGRVTQLLLSSASATSPAPSAQAWKK